MKAFIATLATTVTIPFVLPLFIGNLGDLLLADMVLVGAGVIGMIVSGYKAIAD